MSSILEIEGWGFLLLLAAIIAFRLLTRKINLHGLLHRKNGSGSVSPERVQLLIATIAFAARYLTQVVQSADQHSLPNVDPQWLYTIGGSSSIYVLGKAATTFRRAEKPFEKAR